MALGDYGALPIIDEIGKGMPKQEQAKRIQFSPQPGWLDGSRIASQWRNQDAGGTASWRMQHTGKADIRGRQDSMMWPQPAVLRHRQADKWLRQSH
ncbi:hypothetical protein [uncultured Paracoccus sp.]|uniref:hypothetical protein n=1 Tax=uncultured Paracoccus sp. TaxID=189685 RepID=UPI0026243C06|nr:hypothetical protein [uncultured Paracoccus sp.]